MPAPLRTLGVAAAIACAPAAARADFLAVAWGDAAVWRITPGGQATLLNAPGGRVNALARLLNGRFYTSLQVNFTRHLYELDPATGQYAQRAGFGLDARSMAAAPDGHILAFSDFLPGEHRLYHVNRFNGEYTPIGTPLLHNGMQGMTRTVDGLLFGWNSQGLHLIDPATGERTDVNPDDEPPFIIQGLTQVPSTGQLVGVAGGQLHFIDTETGLIASSINIAFPDGTPESRRDLRGIDWIPAPSTAALLLAPLTALAPRRRRG